MSQADATPELALAETIKAMLARARETGDNMIEPITEARRRFYELTGAEGPDRE